MKQCSDRQQGTPRLVCEICRVRRRPKCVSAKRIRHDRAVRREQVQVRVDGCDVAPGDPIGELPQKRNVSIGVLRGRLRVPVAKRSAVGITTAGRGRFRA